MDLGDEKEKNNKRIQDCAMFYTFQHDWISFHTSFIAFDFY